MLIPNQHATGLELRNEQELLPTERRDQSCEGFNVELKRIWNWNHTAWCQNWNQMTPHESSLDEWVNGRKSECWTIRKSWSSWKRTQCIIRYHEYIQSSVMSQESVYRLFRFIMALMNHVWRVCMLHNKYLRLHLVEVWKTVQHIKDRRCSFHWVWSSGCRFRPFVRYPSWIQAVHRSLMMVWEQWNAWWNMQQLNRQMNRISCQC